MTYLAPKYGSPERAPQRAARRTPRQPTASTSLRTADGCLSRSGQQASPRPPRLRARLSASQCGQAIPDRVCTLFTCAGRSSALRCVPPVSAVGVSFLSGVAPRPLPSAKIDSVVCCSAASGLQGYLSCMSCISGGLLVWWSCYIAVLSLLRRRDTPYRTLYHLAN